jgi:hypothetical protein
MEAGRWTGKGIPINQSKILWTWAEAVVGLERKSQIEGTFGSRVTRLNNHT